MPRYVTYDNIEAYIAECLLAFTYYTEYHMSYREMAQEMCLSASTCKNRLLALETIAPHKFKEYKEELKRRQGHR